MFTYKNISKHGLELIGVGFVAPGDEIKSEEQLYSPHLQEVVKKEPKKLPKKDK